jgi:omega-amidase
VSTLNVSLLQSSLAWHDGAANRERFEQRIRALPATDVIVLPEMFTTGFSMQAQALAETMDGPSVAWMREMAHASDAAVCGSLIVRDGDHCYNRFVWMPPAGQPACYDKRHLFRMAGEDGHYRGGQQRCVFRFRGWRVLPLVCYDLRFPVWSRSVAADYDLMICVANWPTPRRNAWQTLLRARAIENVSYVAAVNRVGEDGNGVGYSGDSAAIDYLGHPLVTLAQVEADTTVALELEPLRAFREKFPVHLDADRFDIL